MSNNDIANRIEEIIGRMFSVYRELELAPKEYLMFYNPKKDFAWYILIFFQNNTQLNKAIKTGICYNIHSFLLNEITNSEVSNIENVIYFESGNRPTEMLEMEMMFEKLLQKTESLKKSSKKESLENCGCCGHDLDKHQLMCYHNESGIAPTDGWIVCPEDDCNCFLTWGSNYV